MSGEIDNGGEGFKMPSLPSVAPPPAKPVPQIPEDNFEKPSKIKREKNNLAKLRQRYQTLKDNENN